MASPVLGQEAVAGPSSDPQNCLSFLCPDTESCKASKQFELLAVQLEGFCALLSPAPLEFGEQDRESQ